MKTVQVWTDGACCGNPGPGGWSAILVFRDVERELTGAESHATNNQMELMGPIAALQALKEPCIVEIFSDSQYVVRGFNDWMAGWKRRNWKTAAGADVKNRDLWLALDQAAAIHSVTFYWVRGHGYDPMNVRADKLAVEARLSII